MKELNLEQIVEVNGGVSGGEVLLGIAIGYVGSKIIDAAVETVKNEVKESKERTAERNEGKEKVLTRRGYRYQ